MDNINQSHALEVFYCEYTISIIQEINDGKNDFEIMVRLLSEKDDYFNANEKIKYIRKNRRQLLKKIEVIKNKWKTQEMNLERGGLEKRREEMNKLNRKMESQGEMLKHMSPHLGHVGAHLGLHIIKSFFGIH